MNFVFVALTLNYCSQVDQLVCIVPSALHTGSQTLQHEVYDVVESGTEHPIICMYSCKVCKNQVVISRDNLHNPPKHRIIDNFKVK